MAVHPQQWETKTWSWWPLRQPRVSHRPKLGPWETTMPDRNLLRGSIVSHLNHTPPAKRKSPRQGQKIPSAPLTAGKSCCRGRKRPSAPLAAGKRLARSEAPSGACREKGEGRREKGGAMRRPEGTRREGFRRPQADRRGTAKPRGGILSPVPWGCRGNQWGPREARIPHEPRNASKNAGVDAVSEGFEPPVRCRTPVFEAGSFNHSDNSPSNRTTKVGKNLILP